MRSFLYILIALNLGSYQNLHADVGDDTASEIGEKYRKAYYDGQSSDQLVKMRREAEARITKNERLFNKGQVDRMDYDYFRHGRTEWETIKNADQALARRGLKLLGTGALVTIGVLSALNPIDNINGNAQADSSSEPDTGLNEFPGTK